MDDFQIIVGGFYKHKVKGTKYIVIAISNENATPDRKDEFPITAVYKDVKTQAVWSSKIEAFKDRVEPIENEDNI